MVCTWAHGIDTDSWNWQGLMVQTWTHGIENTHGIDLYSWYRIGTPESHTYKRNECCPYAGCKKFYVLKIRSILMFGAVCFHSSLSLEQRNLLELQQKRSLVIILGSDYRSYSQARSKKMLITSNFVLEIWHYKIRVEDIDSAI